MIVFGTQIAQDYEAKGPRVLEYASYSRIDPKYELKHNEQREILAIFGKKSSMGLTKFGVSQPKLVSIFLQELIWTLV